MHRTRITVLSGTMAVCLLAGCGGQPGASRPSTDSGTATDSAGSETAGRDIPSPSAEPEDTTSADFEGTAGILEKEAAIDGVALLQDVRTARHEGFDRVVFEFGPAGLPGYHIEYIDRPVRACGSGEAVEIAGDGWLEIRMTPANAHTEAGEPTVSEREQMPGLPIVRELQLTCDFEAYVTWVLGTASPNRYRVLELSNPPRLVVDVRH